MSNQKKWQRVVDPSVEVNNKIFEYPKDHPKNLVARNNFRTSWCVNCKKCKIRDFCNYAHSESELRKPICLYWYINNSCKNYKCRFEHSLENNFLVDEVFVLSEEKKAELEQKFAEKAFFEREAKRKQKDLDFMSKMMIDGQDLMMIDIGDETEDQQITSQIESAEKFVIELDNEDFEDEEKDEKEIQEEIDSLLDEFNLQTQFDELMKTDKDIIIFKYEEYLLGLERWKEYFKAPRPQFLTEYLIWKEKNPQELLNFYNDRMIEFCNKKYRQLVIINNKRKVESFYDQIKEENYKKIKIDDQRFLANKEYCEKNNIQLKPVNNILEFYEYNPKHSDTEYFNIYKNTRTIYKSTYKSNF